MSARPIRECVSQLARRAAGLLVAGALVLPGQSDAQTPTERVTYQVDGRVESPELVFAGIDAGVVFNPNARLIHKPERNAYKDQTRGAIRFLKGAGGGVRGGIIDAGGSYAGIFVAQNARYVVIDSVDVRNAAFKSIHIMSDAEVRNSTVSSNIDGRSEKYRPMGLLIDPGSKQAKRVVVEDLTLGMFRGSAEGQMVKVACTDYVRLTNIQTPVLDEDSVFSLSLAENLKTVIVTDSTLPRLVAHFPDERGEPTIDLLVFSNVTFGNDTDPPLFNHEHLNARTVIYHNCTFRNVQRKVIDDDTPAEKIKLRAFIGCTFDTASNGAILIEHDEGNQLLAGKVVHSGCKFNTRDQGRFVLPADWDKSAVAVQYGGNVEGLIKWIEGTTKP